MNIYGLIGFPLSHSFSEKYFTEFFKKEKIAAIFKNFSIENLEQFNEIIHLNNEIKGLAITIPYKKSILPFLDIISPEVQHTGACNCIQIRDGKCIGFNTDIIGFEKSFLPLLNPQDTHALILGTGGAAVAAAYVLKKNKIQFLFVSRKKYNAENTITYDDLDENILQQFTIIINATQVGQFPNMTSAPNIPYQFITPQHFLFDMIYNPAETQFLKNGLMRSARIKNGLEMLKIQAMENWRIWNT